MIALFVDLGLRGKSSIKNMILEDLHEGRCPNRIGFAQSSLIRSRSRTSIGSRRAVFGGLPVLAIRGV